MTGFWEGFIKQAKKDLIAGGLADKTPFSEADKQELERGIKVEREHTKNPEIAKEIASDHLVEHKDYYKKLKKAGL